jgi:Outer membrane protein beta-barrel domain
LEKGSFVLMLNVRRLSCVWTLLLCLLAILAAPTAKAQESQNPALDRQLDRIDLSVSGVGTFNSNSSGTAIVDAVPTTVDLHPGNTLGVLVNLRYIKSPLLGFELNYGYARYTDTFTPFGILPPPGQPALSAGVQQNTSEYTAGYIAHLHPLLGVKPFASVGLGTLAFRPTPRGGEGLIKQARAAYYYSVGAEQTVFSPHFGIRVQVRQVFFKAPDFGQNYLTIQQHTSTFEPGVGFFLHF